MTVQHGKLGISCEMIDDNRFQVEFFFNDSVSLHGLSFRIQVDAQDENDATAKAYEKYKRVIAAASEEAEYTLDRMFKRMDIVNQIKSASTYTEAFELIKEF